MKDIIIIGGGLAGLISAIELSRFGLKVLLIEKKHYPFHKVCGEYISNEVLPYLYSLNIDIHNLGASKIGTFLLSSPSGKHLTTSLDLGGFGISRYKFDSFLCDLSKASGAEIITGMEVEKVDFKNDSFIISLVDGRTFESRIAIGAYGKRSKLDKAFGRKFIERRSPYVGVKYHIETNFPSDLIALHNFKDGYCGISKVEGLTYNLCYLTHRNNLKDYKSIPEMEKSVLFKNPFLKDLFTNSNFLFDKPEVINEISFEKKGLIEHHLLMVGDSAGMITPLCGNGMAMAIHGARILCESIKQYFTSNKDRTVLETNYLKEWNRQFSGRLLVGRTIQKLFGKEILSELMVSLFNQSPELTRLIIKKTHGNEF